MPLERTTPAPLARPGGVAGPPPRRTRAGAPRAFVGWLAGSVGYIYVYLRGKLDAGERRRLLVEERDGAERLLSGAVLELGGMVLKEGVHEPDFTGLLEAIGRAEAQREAALADVAASERLQTAEEERLAAQESVLEAEWRAANTASREADELLKGATQASQGASSRLGRVRDERARFEREAAAAAAQPDGRARLEHLRHELSTLTAEEQVLEEQTSRLERQLRDLRQRATALRAAANDARAKLDQSVGARRESVSAMAASVAAHNRERAQAEREIRRLTEQLGQAAAQTRPRAPALASAYERIERLQARISERKQEIAAIDKSLAHYDQKKLYTGVGLVAGMAATVAATLWAVLK